MAPRKTKIETAPVISDAERDAAEGSAERNDLKLSSEAMAIMDRSGYAQQFTELLGTVTANQLREDVAKHVLPSMLACYTPELRGDENQFGAICRSAFELADAFVATARKWRQVDGRD